MKKICYLTIESITNDGAGVEYKINRQIKEFDRHGYDVVFCQYNLNRKGLHKITSNLSFLNRKYNQCIIDSICSCDLVYIRYFLMDFNVCYILKEVKTRKPNIKIIIEIPTYPYDQEFPNRSLSLVLDKINRKKLDSYVDKIVTFSDDKKIWNIDTINISNGVDTEKIGKRKFVSKDNRIHCIAVAKIAFWHGYDRLIEGLYLYTNKPHIDDFVLHIVGDGDDLLIEELKAKTIEYNLQDSIIFHGRKVGVQLSEIYSYCSIAFDSLGRHRCGIEYNSTLKGKEYLAKGLPVVSGVKTELDGINDFHYYYRVPADDSPIDFKKIAQFYHSIYDEHDISAVTDEIRNFCIDNFSFDITFKKVIDLFE